MVREGLSFLTNSGLFYAHITTLFSLTGISVTRKCGEVLTADKSLFSQRECRAQQRIQYSPRDRDTKVQKERQQGEQVCR